MKSSLDRIIELNTTWSNKGGPVSGALAMLGENVIFSSEELSKLQEAQRLIEEVQGNYRSTHYELRNKVK